MIADPNKSHTPMVAKTAVDPTKMREMNLASTLNALRLNAPVSRTGLARLTGLSKGAISSLMHELQNRQLVSEVGTVSGSRGIGRPAISLRLNPEAGSILAAEIGVDFISVILANFAGQILGRSFQDTRTLVERGAILDGAIAMLRGMCKQFEGSGKPIFGLSIGVPGIVDASSGKLLFAPNLGWRDVPLLDIAKQQFDFPVFVDNEAKLAALGETYFGAGQGSDFVLYVSSGVGVGGGIVLNGLLLSGSAGFAGEVGHMKVVQNGIQCNCGGTGCWETLASQSAVFRRVRNAVDRGEASWLLEATDGSLDKLSMELVVEAARRGDAVALDALHETGRWLGVGIANLMNVLNPHRVVFGGVVSLAQEFLLPELTRVVSEIALPWVRNTCDIRVASHGADACVMGGIAKVYHKILTSPTGAL